MNRKRGKKTRPAPVEGLPRQLAAAGQGAPPLRGRDPGHRDRALRRRPRSHPRREGRDHVLTRRSRQGERLLHRPPRTPRARRQDPQRRTARRAQDRPGAPAPESTRTSRAATGGQAPPWRCFKCADRAVHHPERNRMMARTKRSRRAYSAGEWGRNRVRIFPDPKTGMFQIEWREDGRRLTRSLKHRDWRRAEEAGGRVRRRVLRRAQRQGGGRARAAHPGTAF